MVNLLGCTFAGALAGFLAPNAPVFFLLSTGFLGGFTTFSTAVLDAVMLLRRRRYVSAVGLVFGVWLGGSVLAICAFLLTSSFAM